MYPQYGEPRFPPGQDYGPGQARMPLDRAGAMGRYPYPGYYGPKGAEGSQYGGMSVQSAQRSMMGSPYGSKTPNMSAHDSAYGQTWNSMGYMGPPSKSSVGSPYSMQTDMYGGMGPGQPAGGYPDLPPNALGMGGYTGGSSYPGPPNPYMPGGSQRYPSYQRSGMPPSHVGMMPPPAPASPGVASEGESGFSGSVPPYPGGPSRSTGSLSSNRTWSNQDLTQGGSWSQGYPPGGPSTPGQQHPLPGSSPLQSQSSSQQPVQGSSQVYRQTSQQSFGAMSPQTPYSNQSQQQLTKQSSISSIRDALMAAPNQQQSSKSYDSPVMPQSPMTPTVKPTPDGTLPAGTVLSPSSVTRQDSQLSTESLSRQSTELQPVHAENPFSGDMGGVHQLENSTIPGSQDVNSVQSTPLVRLGGEGTGAVQDSGEGGRPDNLGLNDCSPLIQPGQPSPSMSMHGKGSESKTPVLSPVTRNHTSIINQYSYSDDQQRKEFLDSLFGFLEKEGISISRPPMVCKTPLDLYRVYTSVQHHGGFLNVLDKRLWRDVIKSSVSSPSNPTSSSTRTLQQYYAKFLLPYECHVTNLDLSLCQSKLENSVSRHTSISSPGSQLSSDGEMKERVVNHHPDSVGSELVNDTQMNGNDAHLSDKELASERLGQRINSNESSEALVSNGQESQLAPDGTGSIAEGLQSQNHEKDSMEVAENSENSMDSFPQELMDPLPEMSVQDAESVLGMSPSPYPNQQPPGGPATPSANQNVPSPSHYSSHFPPRPRPGATPFMDMGEINSPMNPPINPPSYPPSYPTEPTNSPYQMSSRSSFPPGYSPLPQYEGPPDIHPGMGQPPYMPSPYPSSGSPFPPSMSGQRSMDYPPGMYGPEHMMSQPPGMGVPSEMPPYHSPHSMHPDWTWQQRSRMLSPLPPHLQSPSLHQRYMHQHSMMRQQAMLQQQQHARAGSTALSQSLPRASSDAVKIQWQEQNRSIRVAGQAPDDKLKSLKPLPKPDMAPHNKSLPLKEQSDSLKRKLPDWSNCVEGTRPHLVKRRNLYSGDCGHVEPWRVMMSLKSGLLAESTWALDTLNILLHDDRTVGFFYLKHHHSLLNTLVDHFKMVLNLIFGLDFDDTPIYQPGYEGDGASSENQDEIESTKELFAEAMVTDFDVALKKSTSDEANSRDDKTKPIVPVANVFDPEQMKLGRSDDLGHIQIPSVNNQLFYPEPDIDLSIMPQSKRKALEDGSKLQRVDQTPVHVLLKRELIMSQIPLHRNGRPLRSPRGRERNFLGEMRRRESLGRADIEGSITGLSKDTVASTPGDSRKELPHNHAVRPRSDSVFTSPGKSHRLSSPTLTEEYEIHHKEQLPLWTVSPSRESLQARCLCISNILRSLSFIPGNDYEFSQHAGILIVLGRLLMLHHDHLLHSKRKSPPLRQSTSSEEKKSPIGDKLSLKHEEKHFPPCNDFWWWDCLDGLREDTLVILSNISGQLDLSIFPELISYPIIDGLLHWSVCPSAIATDPLPETALVSSLSPQRLVLETLAKMSISEVNVDLILATPPLTRLDMLFARLGQFIGEKRHPVVRQFALVLLSNLAQGNDASSRQIGQQKMIVILLLQCLEVAEHNACSSGGKLVGGYNPEDPNSLSVAMLRRAATTLHGLSKIPANRTILLCHRDRILYLCTSQYLEHSVSSILMDILFELGKL